MTMDEKVEKFKRRLIERAFQDTDGSVTEAAKRLGINRTTLSMRLKTMGLKKPAPEPPPPTIERSTGYADW